MRMTASDKSELGVVQREYNLSAKRFVYYDASKQKVAVAKMRHTMWRTAIDIFDCTAQKKIGAIEERRSGSLFSSRTIYAILDGSGKEVAVSEKKEPFSATFEIRSKTNSSDVVTMRRPGFRLVDKWTIARTEGSEIDPRIFVFIPAFKTSADNDRKSDDAKIQKPDEQDTRFVDEPLSPEQEQEMKKLPGR